MRAVALLLLLFVAQSVTNGQDIQAETDGGLDTPAETDGGQDEQADTDEQDVTSAQDTQAEVEGQDVQAESDAEAQLRLAILKAVRETSLHDQIEVPDEGEYWVPSSQHAALLPAKKEKHLRKKLQKDLNVMNKEVAHFYNHRKKEYAQAQSDVNDAVVALKDELKRNTPSHTLLAPYPLYRDHIVEVLLERDPNVPLPAYPQEAPTIQIEETIPYTKKVKKSQKYVNLVARFNPYVLQASPVAPNNFEDTCSWVYTDTGFECLMSGEILPARKKQKEILIDPTLDVAVDLSSRGFHNIEDALLEESDDCVDFYKDKRSGVILCVPAGSKARHYRKQDLYQHGGGVLPKYWTSANKVYWKEFTTRQRSPIPADHIATTFINTVDLGPAQQLHYKKAKKSPQQPEWDYADQRVPNLGEIRADDEEGSTKAYDITDDDISDLMGEPNVQ